MAGAVTCLLSCQAPNRGGDNGGGGSQSSGTGGSSGSGGSSSGGNSGSGGSKGGSGGSSIGSGGANATGGSGNGGSVATGGKGGSSSSGGSGGSTSSGGSGGSSGNTGGGGGTGGSGTGGAAGSPLSRGPTPPTNGTNFPFPQNRQMSSCIYPTAYDNDDVTAAYTKWKADLVVSDSKSGGQRVQRTSTDGVNANTPANSTVSEGIGYGLIIAVYMGDHTLFDNLWKYEQAHLDPNGLMNWSIDSSGNTTSSGGMTLGGGGATDADEDMAWALAMADKQWGSAGTNNYLKLAQTQIGAIWNHEVYQSKLAGPGDSWGPTNLFNDINISYFAPAYYRLFKQLDSSHDWDAVNTTVYDTIFGPSGNGMGALNSSNKNTTNGLVPGWCTSTGGSSSAGPFNYQYDACRTPFRIGVDWCLNASSAASAATAINPSRAQAYVKLTTSFFSGVGAAAIVDGYNMDGTLATGANPVSKGQSAAFLGPAGVGAMGTTTGQAFLDATYNLVKGDNLFVGGEYYDSSWTVMSLLMMTGNFLDYTQISPATN
jgi:endo-1,4-beta-D-glucanase Y